VRVVRTIAAVREAVGRARREGRVVGLVPTMGCFHQGHCELMRRARRETGFVVVSLFVNPTQFAPGEDLDRYPRAPERDRKAAAACGVDLLFTPDAAEMYPEGCQTCVEVPQLSRHLCGASRPGHFSGVATVCTKLFNIVQPDIAYFGEKDAQQLRIIRRLTVDLNLPLEIRSVPTFREPDGLAMSSRNSYLRPEERRAATVLYRALRLIASRVAVGEDDVATLAGAATELIEAEPLVGLEYLTFCDSETLEPCKRVRGPVLVALAARVGQARLIDNILVNPPGDRQRPAG